MSKSVAYVALIAFTLFVVVASLTAPDILSDKNTFLLGFVNHELLAVLGVILAITLASTAQLHLTFNKIEESYEKKGGLARSRRSVHGAAYWLISLFVGAVVIVVVKPLLATHAWSQSLFNGAALLVLLWNILLLVSITQTIFLVEPYIKE